MQKQIFLTLFVALTIIGCGPKGLKTEFVEGVVTLDGAPLAGAVVSFIPVSPNGIAAIGHTDESGKYMLTSDKGGLPQAGAVGGDYVITVTKHENRPVQMPGQQNTQMQQIYGYSQAEYTVQVIITPQIYRMRDTTPLKATVQKGRNDLPFKMTSR
jgi:hypothetical protein